MGCASSSEVIFHDLPQLQQRSPPHGRPLQQQVRPLFEHSDEYPADEAFFWRVMWKAPPALDVELVFPAAATTHYAKRWMYFQGLLKLIESTPGAFAVLYQQAQRMAEDLATFEGIQDSLLQLAQTGFYFDLVFRFDLLLDDLFAAYAIPTLAGLVELARKERAVRTESLRALLKDDTRLRAELSMESPDTRSFELLTLIKYNRSAFAHRLLPIEVQMLEDAYEWIVHLSGMVLVSIPDWFRPTDEILAHYNVQTNDRGNPLQTAAFLRDESFEVLLLRSEQMRCYAREFDIGFVAASYVGEAAYLCEPVIPDGALAVLRLENAPRWLYLWQVAKAIESLHDRRLVIGSFSWYHVDLSVPGRTLKLRSIRYVVPLPTVRAAQRDAAIAEKLWPPVAYEPPSTAWDVFCLGKCIFDLLREAFDPSSAAESVTIEYSHPLPPRPKFIQENEWRLIQDMCSSSSSQRPLMGDVVQRLHELMVHEDALLSQHQLTIENVNAIDCPPFSNPIADLLRKTVEFITSSAPVAILRREINVFLYNRLSTLYKVLVNRGLLPKRVAECFGALAVDFMGLAQSCTRLSTDEVYNFVTYHAQVEMYLDIHRGLDDCLTGFEVPRSDSVWDWRQQWELLDSKLQETLLHQLRQSWNDGAGKYAFANGTLALLQFELTRRRFRYDDEELELLKQISLNLSKSRDNSSPAADSWSAWFIPEYELNCPASILSFDPGQRLDGKWRGRPVSVRLASNTATSEQIASFVESTFVLNHPNVHKVLGGCHVGDFGRFIVRDKSLSTLADLTRGKDSPYKWKYLLDVAKGVEYLHFACVAVMDLSASLVCISQDGQALVSVRDGVTPRWAAPERLEGGPATAYSDIYAFGMCVLEVLSGDIPWGSDVTDEFVVDQVRQGNLPPQPENVVKDDWALIRRLCAKDPAKRVGLSIAIAAAIHAERTTKYTAVA
jgi:hypothetical protein